MTYLVIYLAKMVGNGEQMSSYYRIFTVFLFPRLKMKNIVLIKKKQKRKGGEKEKCKEIWMNKYEQSQGGNMETKEKRNT